MVGEVETHRREVGHTAAFGRFAIVDDSGTAIVDDDCVVLWAGKNAHTIRNKVGEVTWTISAGDSVEVIGAARWVQADDIFAISPGYRDRGELLSIEGSPEAPIILVLKSDG